MVNRKASLTTHHHITFKHKLRNRVKTYLFLNPEFLYLSPLYVVVVPAQATAGREQIGKGTKLLQYLLLYSPPYLRRTPVCLTGSTLTKLGFYLPMD